MADGGGAMTLAFKPDQTNTRVLRDAFGRFASGITIVTAATPDGPIGITANSFSSLSLDPPLILWSPSVGSRRFPYFEQASHFAVHILSADQQDLCLGFAKSGFAFDQIDTQTNDTGVPLIPDCLARFECETQAIYPGGDHKIVVGRVLNAEMTQGDALTFYAGQFRTLPA